MCAIDYNQLDLLDLDFTSVQFWVRSVTPNDRKVEFYSQARLTTICALISAWNATDNWSNKCDPIDVDQTCCQIWYHEQLSTCLNSLYKPLTITIYYMLCNCSVLIEFKNGSARKFLTCIFEELILRVYMKVIIAHDANRISLSGLRIKPLKLVTAFIVSCVIAVEMYCHRFNRVQFSTDLKPKTRHQFD